MRTSGWMKRQPWFWPAKRFLKRISGKELWLKPEVVHATQKTAEWTYIVDRLSSSSVVYSLGVGDNIDFDLGVIEKFGARVYAFDPTPYAKEWVEGRELPPGFEFKPWAASGEDGSLRLYRRVSKRGKKAKVMWTAENEAGDSSDFIDAPAYTVRTIMEKLGHDKVDLLKMDVEGAEYGILDGLKHASHPPEQLLVEFHHRFPGIGKERTAAAINGLAKIGYKIFDVSDTGREIGFVLTIGDTK
ncbi:MAG: FkbM family methyltransferase [Gammaproteobacteria bacterium]|nr:FkbM family methyltransferase [Gammaproteobacteria bacterium]